MPSTAAEQVPPPRPRAAIIACHPGPLPSQYNPVTKDTDTQCASPDFTRYTNPRHMVTIVSGAPGDIEGDDSCANSDGRPSIACTENYGARAAAPHRCVPTHRNSSTHDLSNPHLPPAPPARSHSAAQAGACGSPSMRRTRRGTSTRSSWTTGPRTSRTRSRSCRRTTGRAVCACTGRRRGPRYDAASHVGERVR